MTTKKAAAKKPTTKAAPKKLPTIAEASQAFRVKEASARAAILLRLLRDLGKPVSVDALVKEVGERSQMTSALRVLRAQVEANKAPFEIAKSGEGESVTYTLKRTG